MASTTKLACFAAIMLFFSAMPVRAEAWLRPDYYAKTCPAALPTIKGVVSKAVATETRTAASLIRLHFHDCFVQGCDGSLLLDDSPTIDSEKNAVQNTNGSVRRFDVVDSIKSAVEAICPGVVSCADILAVAARDSSVLVNGPTWTVKLGRRDSRTANRALAQANLPLASFNLSALITNFANQGLSVTDMVALSGSHTVGLARCTTFRPRIYNDTNIDPGFASLRRQNCPAASGNGDANLAPLDQATPNNFDVNYFKNLLQNKGLLHSDQALYGGVSTDALVTSYTINTAAFFSDFASAMVKMGDISPLTGSSGEIRKNCRVPN